MRIERFQIQGFKSIADVTVDGLADINVFFGLNDVGKSNIFQALELWHWLLSNASGPSERLMPTQLKQIGNIFGAFLFRLGGNNIIQLSADVILDKNSIVPHNVRPDIMSMLNARFSYLNQDKMGVKVDIELVLESENIINCTISKTWEGSGNFDLHPRDLGTIVSKFHIIKASRRIQTELRQKDNSLTPVDHHNLKQALFYAYLSSDLGQKKRLIAIKKVISEPPYNLGELDVALDPQTDQIDIGFVRPNGRLPIENLGLGSQQLLLVLGQIFLNDSPIIAVEEPEMNLSPQYQEYLMVALRKLMQDPAIKLQQLFISTHSPYLEFAENFYDVIFDPVVGTQVIRATKEKHSQHFSVTPIGPDSGARLNSLNQVKLYDGLIQDLALQRGDLVIFVRNDAGRWEIRPAEELAHELQAITNGKG